MRICRNQRRPSRLQVVFDHQDCVAQVAMEAARAVQQRRFARLSKPNVLVNGDMGPAETQAFCQRAESGRKVLPSASAQMNLSARACHRVLKLARTSANLAGCDPIQVVPLAKALMYRLRTMASTLHDAVLQRTEYAY